MLRLKRKRLKITQIEASKILGIDNSYLSLIENHKRCNLNKDLIKKICLLYQIELTFFLSWLNNN
ncbi:hypothetical protein UT300013_33550 [Paraclostridium sordellii]